MLKGEGGSTAKKRGSSMIEGVVQAGVREGSSYVLLERKKTLKKHRARAGRREKNILDTPQALHPNCRPTRWASDGDSRAGGMLKGEGSSTAKKRGSSRIEGESRASQGEGRVVVCPAGKKKKHRAHRGEKKHTHDTADLWHSVRKPTKCQMDGDSSRGQGKRLRHLRGKREGQLDTQGGSDVAGERVRTC